MADISLIPQNMVKGLENTIPETGDLCSSLRTFKNGWLLCDGKEYSRDIYKELFNIIGTIFGIGDGSTTFNVPDLRGKFLQGNFAEHTIGTTIEAGLPNITGEITIRTGMNNNNLVDVFTTIENLKPLGAFIYKDIVPYTNKHSNLTITSATKSAGQPLAFDASKSNSIYGNSTTVQPPSITVNYFIKY